MSKRISNFDELPEWFRNTNYLEADNFTALDWCFHITSRSLASFQLNYLKEQDQRSEAENTRNHCDESEQTAEEIEFDEGALKDSVTKILSDCLKRTRANPVEIVSGKNSIRELGAVALLFDPLNSATSPAISRTSLYDVYDALRFLSKEDKKAFFDFVNNEPSRETLRIGDLPFEQWAEIPIVDLYSHPGSSGQLDLPSFGLFKANLWLDDDYLESEFRQFLKSMRSREQESMAGLDIAQSARRDRWVNYGVLPYIDLKIWADQENRHISSGFLARAFAEFSAIRDSNSSYSSATIDTTVKKYASYITSQRVVHALFAEARKEMAEDVH